ncbi:MAG: translation initiation factor IF-3 [Phycisphaerae bacterium]
MSKGTTTSLRCNEQIRISPIRLIGAANEQIGVIETYEAMKMARESGLDLVEVAPTERPPVCRIMDYGKFKYQQKKKHKKHHEQQLKEVRLRPKTDSHDRGIKVNRAISFLAKGDKVQFTMVFRGRERAHMDVAFTAMRDIQGQLSELVKLERPPSMDGRNMIMIVSPVKAALDKLLAAGKVQKVEEHDEDDDDIEDDHDDHEDAPATPGAAGGAGGGVAGSAGGQPPSAV